MGTFSATAAWPYEADVHHGLTRWLALKAGYAGWQADAIATGNVRVDSGTMSTLSLLPEYACLGRDDELAAVIQQRHYPSASLVPAEPGKRRVEAGSAAARLPLSTVTRGAQGKESQYLGLLGAALHTLQDSWAHEGVPGVPALGVLGDCDATRGAVPPSRARGGPHAADQTRTAVGSTLAMAKSTYEALTAFPAVQGVARVPENWSSLEPAVKAFAAADSKTAKRRWFAEQKFEATGFLAETSLPDGPDPEATRFDGRQLPSLPNASSTQHGVPADLRTFFDRLVSRWLGDEPVERAVSSANDGSKGQRPDAPRVAQLVARLTLWKVRDHGRVAELVHANRPLSARDLKQVASLAGRPSALIEGGAAKALFPLVALGREPSPLLPYIVRMKEPSGNSPARAVALLRLMHAPRDTVALVAERTAQGWTLVDVASVVDQ